MIPLAYINEWQQYAPWPLISQVEQDLVISRALIEIFDHPPLKKELAFRGGTALFKLHLAPARYSEDIDLVQVTPGPIGALMDAIQERINPWLGSPRRKQSEGRVTLIYSFASEEGLPLKLKIEINSREHFSVLGFDSREYSVQSRWYTGKAVILSYHLDELLGTKIRALYQRKKGRDLFDLWKACTTAGARPERIVECFLQYMQHEGHGISRAEFEKNLRDKFSDPRFQVDIEPLLTTDNNWNFQDAAQYVLNNLIVLIP